MRAGINACDVGNFPTRTLPRARVGQHLSENMSQDQRQLTISRGCCGLCLGMELFVWRIAALPGGNGVLLGMDFIYQVAVGYSSRNSAFYILNGFCSVQVKCLMKS